MYKYIKYLPAESIGVRPMWIPRAIAIYLHVWVTKLNSEKV